MTVEERKEIYIKALKDYQDSAKSPSLQCELYTSQGLCLYFSRQTGNSFRYPMGYDYTSLPSKFPEIFSQRPKDSATFWFKEAGPISQRIKIIKNAIDACNMELNRYAGLR